MAADGSSQDGTQAGDGDPQRLPAGTGPVRIAFSLGWHVEELYHFESLDCIDKVYDRSTESPDPSLPGISSLTSRDRATLLTNQIDNEMPQVWARDSNRRPDLAPLRGLIDAERDAADAAKRTPSNPDLELAAAHAHRVLLWGIYDLHKELLEALTAQDFQIGKGYALGRKLAETFLLCDLDDAQTYQKQFEHARIKRIQDWLSDLKSSLPPHSAHATASGLSVWANWINPVAGRPAPKRRLDAWLSDWLRQTPAQEAPSWDGDTNKIATDVVRQGNIWRSLLSGEKVATDLLTAEDYLKAVQLMVQNVTRLARGFLSGWLGIALAILTVVTLVVAVVVLWRSNNWQQSFTAIVAAVGALGLTAGSLGATLRKALFQAEKPLWDAEVANAIHRASLVDPNESMAPVARAADAAPVAAASVSA
jgi:hypothetical protein